MAVAAAISRAIAEAELGEAEPWGKAHGWRISWDAERPLFTVGMTSAIDKQEFLVEFDVSNYRELPPSIEFLHPSSGERGRPRCYPKGGRGYFHAQPVICAPWNRRAYAANGGPHADWAMSGWASIRPNHANLGDILVLLQELLNDKTGYGGRMAP
jgi:hypothetical protein